ncbi:MAG TPA: cation-translocating P-type ATPase [Anaerolineales bacterium]|nr:cation-translocating P-type ATPase [Anaerolineales bacterium]
MDEARSVELTLHLEIPLLLPDVEDGRDQCVARLQESLLPIAGIRNAHVERDDGTAILCLHYDPNLLSLDRVQRLAREAGAAITERYRHATFRLIGMDCADCAASLEHILRRAPGVLNLNVSYAAERIRVEYDSTAITQESIVHRIRGLGYDVELKRSRSWWGLHSTLILALVAGVLMTAAFIGETVLGLSHTAAVLVYILAYLSAGYDVARHGVSAALHFRFDVDVLMVLAAVGAAALGNWPEGAFLLFLFSLGHALEKLAMDRARNAIEALGQITPKTATVRRAGEERQIPVDDLLRGDVVIVRPGMRLPADGRVSSGRSDVDQSPVTGESMPVEKDVGQEVFAGSVNGSAAIEVEVTRLSSDSTLARVIQMVEEAQTQKAPTQRLVERIQAWFVPAVLGAVVLTAVLPPALGLLTIRESLIRAISLLVAASPCALAMATPSAVLSGIAQGARNGVLIKGGVHLESLGRVRAVAFDKTGTLTRGAPNVTDVIPLGEATAERVLLLAASVESRSAHPLAKAIVRHTQNLGVPFTAVEGLHSSIGLGVEGVLDGQVLRVGGERFFTAGEVALPAELQMALRRLADEGKTTMIVHAGEVFLGVIGLADEPRPEARRSLDSLAKLGLGPIIMLTGDHPTVAEAVARSIGVNQVEAGLMPEDKVRVVRSLRERFGGVAMVGDGVNDAPALAAASVGIAMGGAGTDVALETADVALMGDDLLALPYAFSLGRRARRIILQNLAISMGVISVLVVGAVTGLAGMSLAIVAHESSTLLVVLNALRLLGFRRT